MSGPLYADKERFHEKLRQLKKRGLQDFFHNDELGVVSPEGKVLRIRIPRLEIPQLRFKLESEVGIGMGSGEKGDPVPHPSLPQNPFQEDVESDLEKAIRELIGGRIAQRAYDPAQHDYIEVDRMEFAQELGEYLELPDLRATFGGEVVGSPRVRYNSIRKVGPRSLTHHKRTYKTALQRLIASGQYDPFHPVIVPENDDRRFRAPKKSVDTTKAVVVYVLDCSGSMQGTLDFLQEVAWMADSWIEHHYSAIAQRYVHYDHAARESTAAEFYAISAGGENNMGLAYLLADQILKEYPTDQYNRYVVHLTDGDHFGLEVEEEDIQRYQRARELHPDYFPELLLVHGNPLTDKILPQVNALFVCEAGAYYDDLKGGPGISRGNYSTLLKELIGEEPTLPNKIRLVSFDEERLNTERNRCKLETIRAWFGQKSGK